MSTPKFFQRISRRSSSSRCRMLADGELKAFRIEHRPQGLLLEKTTSFSSEYRTLPPLEAYGPMASRLYAPLFTLSTSTFVVPTVIRSFVLHPVALLTRSSQVQASICRVYSERAGPKRLCHCCPIHVAAAKTRRLTPFVVSAILFSVTQK